MRRISAATAACTLGLAALLAGCSSSSDNSVGSPESGDAKPEASGELSGDVSLWMYPVLNDEGEHKAYWDQQVADFEAENPGVKVTVDIYPWAERDAAITTAISSSTNPDAIYLIPDQLVSYADALADMGSYLPKEHMEELLPSAIEGVTYDGRMLGSPVLMQSVPFVCNAAAFEKAGVDTFPSTWDELRDVAPKLKEGGVYALAYDGSSDSLNHSFYPLLWQAGGKVFNEDGSGVSFAEEPGVKALEFLQEFVDNGWIEKDNVVSYPAFEQSATAKGDVGCLVGSYTIPEIEDAWGAENVVVNVLKDKDKVAYGTVGSLAMFENSKSPEATAAFIDFVTTGDRLAEYLKLSGYFSPLSTMEDLFPGNELSAEIEQTLPYITVGELNTHAREVMGLLQPEIQAALLGQKTPQEALDAAASEADYLF